MFKSTALIALIAAPLLAAFGAAPAAAQNNRIGLVEITNGMKEKARICVYKNKRINLKAEECWIVEPDHSVIWARGEARQNEKFKVKTFVFGSFLPKLQHVRDNFPGDTVTITAFKNNFSWQGYTAPTAPKPVYQMKFCNTGQPSDVWIAIGIIGGISSAPQAFSEGYWSIAPKDCRTFDLTERLMQAGGGLPVEAPRVLYRAFTTGENAITWSGQAANEDPVLCVNSAKKYFINQWDRSAGDVYACDGENETKRRFRWGPLLDKDAQVGLIEF